MGNPGGTAADVIGCFQAGATERAAIIGRKATLFGAGFTIVAALIAFAAVCLQIWIGVFLRKRSVRAIYASEISALHKFLLSNDVLATLKAQHEKSEPTTFHPGDNWLKSYQSDPSQIAVLADPATVSELVTYVCQMLDQLKNLRWLSDESMKFHPTATPPVSEEFVRKYHRIQNDTLLTLTKLIISGDEIAQALGKYTASASSSAPTNPATVQGTNIP